VYYHGIILCHYTIQGNVPDWYGHNVMSQHGTRVTVCILGVYTHTGMVPGWHHDVGVVCPGTQRYGSPPGRAAEAYAAIKAAQTSPTSSHSLWSGPPLSGHPMGVPPTPGLRGNTGDRHPKPQDVVLTGVMQALVRIQAYMLADIVVATPGRPCR
jgi:hypothetical protein